MRLPWGLAAGLSGPWLGTWSMAAAGRALERTTGAQPAGQSWPWNFNLLSSACPISVCLLFCL